MSSKIRVLDDQTINQIAAGEVIENPASVVKELVENSIDAGSTEICVEITGGGRQLIRITDNGCGMNADDALLCLERHATSKIRELDDIHSIFTMGFRGEAIPSIASISKFTLLTCPQREDVGTLVMVDGGKIVKCSPAARSPGTTIEIKSLFFNVPVRKKFQRSPTYDANEILKVMTIQALAHPEIKFQLVNNHKTTFSANVSQGKTFREQLAERIPAILGPEYFSGTCPVETEEGEYGLVGWIGLPAFTRHNRTGQYLFLNRRAVSSPLVSFAIRDAYGTALATNRHPVFVLHMTIPGSIVDVNVHPQKKEVRLRQGDVIKKMIFSSVEEALQKVGIASTPAFSFSEAPDFFIDSTPSDPPPVEPPPSQETTPSDAPVFEPPKIIAEAPSRPPEDPQVPLFEVQERKIVPKVIGTMKGYLLLSSEKEGLRLVDQRAAHSRILYEQFSDRKGDHQTLPIQTLLVPYTLELTPVEAESLREFLSVFHTFGIEIEEFGNNSFVIQAIPQIWADVNIKEFIHELLRNLRDFSSDSVIKRDLEKRLADAAGRAAVSQKAKLSMEEGQSLVNQLFQCQLSTQCPIGKPTMIELTHEEISKQFQQSLRST